MGKSKKDSTPAKAIQVGALCWSASSGKLRVLMITSRTSRRWVIPKGWAMAGLSFGEAAAVEAWEEAGVHGKLYPDRVGRYRYTKTLGPDADDLRCRVDVFALRVKDLAKDWPEKSERRRRWMSPEKAARRVWEPDLAKLLRQFDPRHL